MAAFLKSGDLNGASTARSACRTGAPHSVEWADVCSAHRISAAGVAQMARKGPARQNLIVEKSGKDD